MKKEDIFERGIFRVTVKALRRKNGRCFLKLYIYDLDTEISIDVYDEICETMGVSYLTADFLKVLLRTLPFEMEVSNYNGFWKIENLDQILSDALIKSIWDTKTYTKRFSRYMFFSFT